MQGMSRRQILQILGAGAVGIGCGSSDDESPASPPDENDAGTDPGTDGGPPGQTDPPTGLEMLAEIETFVVVMMENRPFDHFFGALKRDTKYVNAKTVVGTTGKESNPAPSGPKVTIYKANTYTLANPHHDFKASHDQFNKGKNDQFVINHAGPDQEQAMAYYQRSQIPFYYWLADNFTVCDHWYASVMGPTWPNRLYLHAGTSAGKKDNSKIESNAPRTIWDQMKTAKKSAMNYYAGTSAFFTGPFPKDKVNPRAKMDQFFADAKAGTLPALSYIDPDYHANDDHPPRDIRLGQAFVSSIYRALAASPQWSKALLIIIYDEHGGFWDHVAPPVAPDDDADFRQFGFRIPAIIVGPTVKKGYVSTQQYDHTSVLATLAARFDLPALTKRSSKAHTLADVFDPQRYNNPAEPPPNPPAPQLDAAALATVGPSGQEELDAAIANGTVPEDALDRRSPDERTASWLEHAERLGSVRLTR